MVSGHVHVMQALGKGLIQQLNMNHRHAHHVVEIPTHLPIVQLVIVILVIQVQITVHVGYVDLGSIRKGLVVLLVQSVGQVNFHYPLVQQFPQHAGLVGQERLPVQAQHHVINVGRERLPVQVQDHVHNVGREQLPVQVQDHVHNVGRERLPVQARHHV